MVAIEINGKIKTFGEIPKTWNNTSPYHLQSPGIHKADGFLPVVEPSYNTETHRRTNELIKDGETYTYKVVAFTAEEIEQRLKQKAELEKEEEKQRIKEAKLNKIIEDNLTIEERLKYYSEWVQRAYALNEKAIYKGKVFQNNVEGNTNAPDKGGWIEIK